MFYNSRAASSTSSSAGLQQCGALQVHNVFKIWWNAPMVIALVCCGNETFLRGNIDLKIHLGSWFNVSYGVILPWWVPKLRNVGRIPQQSCRKLSCVCLIYCWSMYGACNRWCFFFRNSNLYSAYTILKNVYIFHHMFIFSSNGTQNCVLSYNKHCKFRISSELSSALTQTLHILYFKIHIPQYALFILCIYHSQKCILNLDAKVP